MKGLLFAFAAVVACTCLLAAPLTAQAGGCHGVAVVQSFAVAQPVVVQQAVAVQALAVPVYQPAVVQSFAVAAPVVYSPQNVVQAQAFAGGFARSQAVAQSFGGGSSLAVSRVGPPRPIRNGLAILGAAIAARRSSSFALSVAR